MKISTKFHYRRAQTAQRSRLPLYLLLPVQLVLAQESIVVQNTGSGQPLLSEVRTVFVDAGAVQPRLLLDFGFATDEAITPGTILDSYTLSIQTADQRSAAVYLTADASGTLLAPASPGALVIDPASITLLAITYPGLQPALANQVAYEVSAAVPAEFQGGSVNVFFDLFDNQNAQASQGWFSNVRVVGVASVPENPGTAVLLVLASALCLGVRNYRR